MRSGKGVGKPVGTAGRDLVGVGVGWLMRGSGVGELVDEGTGRLVGAAGRALVGAGDGELVGTRVGLGIPVVLLRSSGDPFRDSC